MARRRNFTINLRSFAVAHYMSRVATEYGPEGVKALKQLLDRIKELYNFVEPELVSTNLVVFVALSDAVHVADVFDIGNADRYEDPRDLAHDYNPRSCKDDVIIHVCESGYYLRRGEQVDLATLSKYAIVYKYYGRKDYIIVKGDEVPVPELDSAFASVFSVPTFRELRDALEDYKRRRISTSYCKLFSQAWYGGATSHRLFFVSGPESKMRDSLVQYLNTTLPDAEVRAEQNMDETHPVDIKVTWPNNRMAIIELKWLGKAINSEGRITQNYSASRARDGAKQLATYLEMNRTHAPMKETRGYLVVIDGRRRGLREDSTSIDTRNGLWYKYKDIDFDPKFHEIRDDFEEPVRMFAEPICNVD